MYGRVVGFVTFAEVRGGPVVRLVATLRVFHALSPPVPEDTWVGRAVAPALLLLPQLPQQLPPPYGACRSGSVFVVYTSSLRVVQLGVGLTMMHNARPKQLDIGRPM